MVFAPLHYEPNYAYPLLVWLHGDGQDEQQLSRVMPQLSLRNFVAVAPRSDTTLENGKYSRHWQVTPCGVDAAAEKVRNVVASALSNYNVNRAKIYLVGSQSGGAMALRLALEYPEFFAGVASLGGSLSNNPRNFCGNLLNEFRHLRDMPVFLGTNEQDIPATNAALCDLKLLHLAGMQIRFRQYQNEAPLCNEMLSDINRWVLGG